MKTYAIIGCHRLPATIKKHLSLFQVLDLYRPEIQLPGPDPRPLLILAPTLDSEFHHLCEFLHIQELTLFQGPQCIISFPPLLATLYSWLLRRWGIDHHCCYHDELHFFASRFNILVVKNKSWKNPQYAQALSLLLTGA